jgi:hypothetical protein
MCIHTPPAITCTGDEDWSSDIGDRRRSQETRLGQMLLRGLSEKKKEMRFGMSIKL